MGAATACDSELHGASKVFASFGDMAPAFHSNVLFARNKMIAEQPDIVQKFVDGWFKTVEYARPS